MKFEKILSSLLVFFCFCFLLTTTVPAGETTHDNTSGTPERICLTITRASDQNQTVSWRTNRAVKTAKAQIIALADFIEKKNLPATLDAKTTAVSLSSDETAYHHWTVFSDLLPDTWYTYRVGNEFEWSEWNRFRTASDKDTPFDFLFLGDIQNEIKPMCSQVLRAACQTEPNARFWLFAGDLVNDGSDDKEWQSFFNALGWMPKSYPLVVVAGNHEYPDPRIVKQENRKITSLWQPHFNLPQNGPKGLEQTCYSFTYQGVLFIILNGNEKLDEQALWMENILIQNKLSRIIAAIHQPAYSTSKRRNKTMYQEIFVPVFDRFGVDLVLQGHDHAYSRTFPLKNHQKTNKGEKGTVYLMSIAGPKSYPESQRYKHLFAAFATGKQLFQSIHVEKDSIEVKAFDLTGKIIDTFKINN